MSEGRASSTVLSMCYLLWLQIINLMPDNTDGHNPEAAGD